MESMRSLSRFSAPDRGAASDAEEILLDTFENQNEELSGSGRTQSKFAAVRQERKPVSSGRHRFRTIAMRRALLRVRAFSHYLLLML